MYRPAHAQRDSFDSIVSGVAAGGRCDFFAALAYPDDLKSRDRFRMAFCHEAFVRKMKQDPEVGRVAIPARYLAPVPGAYRPGLTKPRSRARAGQMHLALIEPRFFGLAPKPSVNQLAGLIAGDKNSTNVKDGDWGQARVVIHAACAFELVREKMQMGGLSDTLGVFIDEPVLIEGVVNWSEQIRTGAPSKNSP